MAKRGTAEIRLGKLELQIMNVVWEQGTATVHDVKDALSRGKTPAYTTVLTMMRNLEAKGYLEHEVDGRTFVYQPTLTRATARQSMLSELLERVFDGSPSLLVNSLMKQKRISAKELGRIRELLRERGTDDE